MIKQEAATVAADRRQLTGLEYMRQVMTGEVPPSGMGQLMNFKLIEVSKGRAVFTIQPDERHYNGLGIVHGGLAATLLDSATGCAINTMMPAGKIFTTLEIDRRVVTSGRPRMEAPPWSAAARRRFGPAAASHCPRSGVALSAQRPGAAWLPALN